MDLESLRPWNPHWFGGPVTPRVLKHPVARAAVPKWFAEILNPTDGQWLLRPGPRQVGKTTSLGHVAARLVEHDDVAARQVVVAPLDDLSIQEACEGKLENLLAAAATQHAPSASKPLFLLLDEVQELPDWARQLKAAWDKHHATVRVLATGSSALRILRPANADFHGRIRGITVHPMKLREVLEAHPDAAERLADGRKEALQQHALACRAALQADQEEAADAFEQLHGYLAAHELDTWVHQVWSEYLSWGGYPATRPGCELEPVQRLERFGAALDTVLARDVAEGGVRKLREFKLLFRGICRNPGGKFEPFSHGRTLGGTDGNTIAHWMQILEDTLLVQQLQPLKPNLGPDNGRDKAYPTDPGWVSFFHGHTGLVPDQGVVGDVAETVLVDHLRRLQFNAAGSTQLASGYVASPEVDAAINLGDHWLLVEAKYRTTPRARLDDIGGEGDIRIVATRDTFQLNPEPRALFLPARDVALIC